MEVLNDILGYRNIKIYQNKDYFLFSLDSIMLANFCTIRKRDKNIIDIGTGNGVIPLIISLRTDKNIDGVEIQKELYDLAVKSISYNKINNINLYNEDIKDYAQGENIGKYDLVVCNPPFFKYTGKNINENRQKAIARHEIMINLEEVIITASRLLANDGNFAMVNRPDRLVEIIMYMKKYNIEPKRIRYVHENIEKPSTLVLIEGQKYGNSGLKIEKPLILLEKDGSKVVEYAKLLEEVNETEEL